MNNKLIFGLFVLSMIVLSSCSFIDKIGQPVSQSIPKCNVGLFPSDADIDYCQRQANQIYFNCEKQKDTIWNNDKGCIFRQSIQEWGGLDKDGCLILNEFDDVRVGYNELPINYTNMSGEYEDNNIRITGYCTNWFIYKNDEPCEIKQYKITNIKSYSNLTLCWDKNEKN